jgi:hypothetical protein
MKKILSLFTFLFLLNFSAFSQVNQEYTKSLQKMFEVSGTEESYKAAIKQMFTMFKKQYSNVKTEIWGELEKEFSQKSINEITEMFAPAYLKYMTKEDLDDLIKFYESPLGEKFAKNTPLIMQETMQIGQEWGMKIGEDFAKKMKERGY